MIIIINLLFTFHANILFIVNKLDHSLLLQFSFLFQHFYWMIFKVKEHNVRRNVRKINKLTEQKKIKNRNGSSMDQF